MIIKRAIYLFILTAFVSGCAGLRNYIPSDANEISPRAVSDRQLREGRNLVMFCVKTGFEKYGDTSSQEEISRAVDRSISECDPVFDYYVNDLASNLLHERGQRRYTEPVPERFKERLKTEVRNAMIEAYEVGDVI